MKFGIDFSESSTLRNTISVIFGATALGLIVLGKIIEGSAVMAAGQQLHGWLGVVMKD